jgi:L-alanine-DL-glutamate epimerase-like enolase superfamily enzyme
MTDAIIDRVEWGTLEARRPRVAGCNARLGVHGDRIGVPVVRLTTGDGISGFGRARVEPELLRNLLGLSLDQLWDRSTGVRVPWISLEYPIWDLAGRLSGSPVYSLLAAAAAREPAAEPFRVRCYDTSLYFDDLHLADSVAAAELIAAEALFGYEHGHRAFKIKVGRGARHMPLEEGTARDVAVVRAVRATVGPDCPIMLDANNGYNLNLTKRVLLDTADCGVFWMEEAFHEDPVLYEELQRWLRKEGLGVLIADGEGSAHPSLLQFAREKKVDVIQYDIFSHGMTRWLTTGRQLDEWGVRSAPHSYGGALGNYVAPHLAACIGGFTFAEWDEARTAGISAEGYALEEGWVTVPPAPGFGMQLDEAAFGAAIAQGGGLLHA